MLSTNTKAVSRDRERATALLGHVPLDMVEVGEPVDLAGAQFARQCKLKES